MSEVFYYVVLGKKMDPETAFLVAKFQEDAYYNVNAIRKKKDFEIVEYKNDENPHKLAEIWVEEDKESPFYKTEYNAGCFELKGQYLTAARRKKPSLKGQKNIRAYLFFGKS